MEQLKFEVEVVSTETIKPSTPTPTNQKLFTLSCIDQTSLFNHFPILLFYPNTTTRDDSGSGPVPNTRSIDITTLKTSLSETLTSFYPLAGRSNSESTILCEDQGIPFIETRVNCNLDDLLNSPRKLYLLGKILPSFQLYMSYGQRPIDEIVHVVIQFNVFLCGGVVVSSYMLHKILDVTSASVFLNYWAALARAKSSSILNLSLNEPDFEATIKAFPPIPLININGGTDGASDGDKTLASRLSYLKSITVVGKSFVFNNAAIKKLKDKVVTSDDNKLTNPTSFEAVTGFIWHHIFAAACTAASLPNSDSGPSELLFTANIRPRISPPLPNTSIGNLTKTVHVRVETHCDISKYATAIHEAISEMNKNVLENLPEKNSSEDLAYKFGSYVVTSWCKLGLSEVDFGFGKPNRVIPMGLVHPLMRNYILMVDNLDRSGGIDGIEAFLFLEENEMQVLESNSQFCVFASPN
ncbi:vinorine synthase-like isoform X2 [Silene latifolia]|uniref:vinorine synthase-like isoform X2 n=1 Tax=Silene latifolia TaxID=37657 RepID=UPI003D776A63